SARLRQGKAAEVAAGLAGAIALWADLRDGAGLGAGAPARLARALIGEPQGHGRAVDRVAERQRGLGLDRSTTPGPGLLRASAAAEHAAEYAAQPASRPGRAEDVAQIEATELASAAARHPDAPAEKRPRLVVFLASLGVRKDVVGLRDLLEPLL